MISDLNNYLTDQEFFTYVKFLNLVVDKNYSDLDEREFGMHRFSIGKEDIYQIFKRLYGFTDTVDLPVKISARYNTDVQNAEIQGEIDDKPEDEKKNLNKLFKAIKAEKKIKFSDVGAMSWAWADIYGSTYFTPDEYTIDNKIRTAIQNNINEYLDNLINNKLAIVKKNYYQFDLQKQCLINLIEEDRMISFYGNNFIIRKAVDEDGNLKQLPDFCILQTVHALQNLGYLKVNNVWEEIEYKKEYVSSEKDRNRFICINITLEDIFIKEINNKYKKENPKNVIDGFDASKGLLKFAGEEINLSAKGKDTDASLLMASLLKAEDDDWKHNDEIFSDWKYNEADIKSAPKNKIYFAAQKINNNVAVKTQIENLIEYTTTKARINPRYKKVDE